MTPPIDYRLVYIQYRAKIRKLLGLGNKDAARELWPLMVEYRRLARNS